MTDQATEECLVNQEAVEEPLEPLDQVEGKMDWEDFLTKPEHEDVEIQEVKSREAGGEKVEEVNEVEEVQEVEEVGDGKDMIKQAVSALLPELPPDPETSRSSLASPFFPCERQTTSPVPVSESSVVRLSVTEDSPVSKVTGEMPKAPAGAPSPQKPQRRIITTPALRLPALTSRNRKNTETWLL